MPMMIENDNIRIELDRYGRIHICDKDNILWVNFNYDEFADLYSDLLIKIIEDKREK